MDSKSGPIKFFVKDILGCQCEDSVFESIVQEKDVRLEPELLVDQVLIIGNRLLIYLYFINKYNKNDLGFILPKLITHGRTRREVNNLNRFRLVLISNDPAEFETQAHEIFNKNIGNDEKIHLHILSENDIILALNKI